MKNQLQQQGISQKRQPSDLKTSSLVTSSNTGRALLSDTI
jgi:hypothetical protein